MQKTCPFSGKIEMPLTNALKSIRNTDTVLFLPVDMSDIDKVKVRMLHIFIRVLENRKE
jgi:hypothetical protein